jgi:triacylglycerol esterase/lipase EstA (alpha/beta hydrolase family)
MLTFQLFFLIEILLIIPFLPVIPLILPLFFYDPTPNFENSNQLVVLIHGSGVGSWQWAMVKTYLRGSNINMISVDYDSTQSIIKSSEKVLSQIPSHRDIILIGHSMGGLVARLIASKVNARKVFLLNTPQHGAPIIDLEYPKEEGIDYGPSTEEMRYQSDFIKSLPELNPNTTYEIVGLNDFVRYSQCISYGRNVYYSWFGHYFTAWNPYLWFSHIIPKLKIS